MLVFEAKLRGTDEQYRALDEALRTARFVRNMCLKYWMENKGVDKYDLNKYCAVLAKEFEFAGKLNSMARQSSAERAWSAISRFFDNCKKPEVKKKDTQNLRNIKLICRLSTRLADGSYLTTEDQSHLLMVLMLVLLRCGVLVTCTITRQTRLNEYVWYVV